MVGPCCTMSSGGASRPPGPPRTQHFRFECIRQRRIRSIAIFCDTVFKNAKKIQPSVFSGHFSYFNRVYSAKTECIRRETECIRRASECIRRPFSMNTWPIRVYSAGFECIRRPSVFGETCECIRQDTCWCVGMACMWHSQGSVGLQSTMILSGSSKVRNQEAGSRKVNYAEPVCQFSKFIRLV